MENNISIRNITLDDTHHIIKWRNSEHVLNNFLDRNILTSETHNNWIMNFVQKEKVMQFIIMVDNVSIGTTFIKNIDGDKSAEFGYFIGEQHYLGKGIGTIAGKLTIEEYYKKFNKSIIARAIKENIASNKALTKIGFKFDYTYEVDRMKINMFRYSGDK